MQSFGNFSSNQVKLVEGGGRGAAEGYENDEKCDSNVGKGTYGYKKEREVEVRYCGVWEGGSEPVEM